MLSSNPLTLDSSVIGFISELKLTLSWVQQVKRKGLRKTLLNASRDEMETMCGVKINMEVAKKDLTLN